MTGTTTIAGRYRIEGRLGVGGMSTVHLAFDQRLERYVAIKLLAEHLADDPTFVSRFRREALAAARLVHPNIVQVFDFGFDEGHHQHFIVMEHVPGHSCAELLRDRGHLDVEQASTSSPRPAAGSITPTATASCTATSSPATCSSPTPTSVKLADFGIARATDQSSITQVGSVLGTAAYLAPEQARGEEAGPRADIYSLGVVTYQLLSGRLPYEATSLSELALKQQRESPIAARTSSTRRVRPSSPRRSRWRWRSTRRPAPPTRSSSPTRCATDITGWVPRIRPPRPPISGRGRRPGCSPAIRARTGAPRAATAATRLAERGPDGRASRAKPAEPRTGRARTPDQRAGRTPTERAGRAPERAARAPDQRRQRQPAPAPPPAGAARRRSSGRAIRWIIGLSALCLIFLIAVVVAVVIAGSTSSGVIHFRSVVAHDAQSAIDSIRQIIQKYTK